MAPVPSISYRARKYSSPTDEPDAVPSQRYPQPYMAAELTQSEAAKSARFSYPEAPTGVTPVSASARTRTLHTELPESPPLDCTRAPDRCLLSLVALKLRLSRQIGQQLRRGLGIPNSQPIYCPIATFRASSGASGLRACAISVQLRARNRYVCRNRAKTIHVKMPSLENPVKWFSHVLRNRLDLGLPSLKIYVIRKFNKKSIQAHSTRFKEPA